MKKPLIIGHRGAMGYETENTLLSFQKALDLFVDMIEIDVYLIKTGELVVFHDKTLKRLASSLENIEDLTLEEVKNINLIGNHQIPTLIEVIEFINKRVPINIELKGENTALPTHKILENYPNHHFLISSFQWNELELMRKINSKIPIALLSQQNHLIAIPLAKKLKAIAINPWFYTLTKHEVEEIHKNGFLVYTYTVNEIIDIKEAIYFGVDGMFCNFPDRIHACL
ncbi:glycerophosphodiester phosphodiesterase family protein [uncultured Flavobacterium sp.]|uniref:glycerophosphodiester phosphodiesterase n=1 Tax=uncultured Flavobacterium sp. TaxID=165435 RepID=UPI0030EE38B0|tara:strand:+ start:265039 stop:265719 length:681 start_codon:yes stop_codon:yes gene_type:complete